MYKLLKLFYDEDGTSPAEYSIMMGVTVVIATAVVVGTLGQRLQDSYSRVNNSIGVLAISGYFANIFSSRVAT